MIIFVKHNKSSGEYSCLVELASS